MPLGKREHDTSNSNLCGILMGFTFNLPQALVHHLADGGFDFLVTPLIHPDYRPSMQKFLLQDDVSRWVMPCGSLDFNVSPVQWNTDIIGKISSWIDLDSEDEALRMDSETTLKQEIDLASYLSLKACLLPAPKGTSCVNYARCVKQILPGLRHTQLWLRIPFGMSDADSKTSSTTRVDSWKTWNSFRLLCDHHSQLKIALDIIRVLPSDNSQKRWYGEPVAAVIIDSDIFNTKSKSRGHGNVTVTMSLSKRQRKLITDIFDHSIQIIITGKQVQDKTTLEDTLDSYCTTDSKAHPLRPCLEHIRYLYEQMDPLTEQEGSEFALRDFLQSPSQPIRNYSEALGHDKFERDMGKYSQYESAIAQALLDTVSSEKASEITAAANRTGRMLRIYAVEKNPNVSIALKELVRSENWDDIVTVVTRDVRCWIAPEKADILVSDFLGSFGDNELSPESIDKAQRCDCFLQLEVIDERQCLIITVNFQIKERKDILNFETPCEVKIHNVFRLAPTQQVFTFHHPIYSDNKEINRRYKKLQFVIPNDPGSAIVHGFAGYFDATLYKDVHLGIEPSAVTPNVYTWHPMFFPLKTPICVDGGSTLEVHFWRCLDSMKFQDSTLSYRKNEVSASSPPNDARSNAAPMGLAMSNSVVSNPITHITVVPNTSSSPSNAMMTNPIVIPSMTPNATTT
ncbi:hypothetical protein VNO77_30465 [Canavalia gladiata]|uniref:Protein arginine N-methyltransferase n=1 Tax=Canavalia gladiata TaxID=3824 RepID=A0AAN9KR45_CANGL